jgi:hypothetical protein
MPRDPIHFGGWGHWVHWNHHSVQADQPEPNGEKVRGVRKLKDHPISRLEAGGRQAIGPCIACRQHLRTGQSLVFTNQERLATSRSGAPLEELVDGHD